jgi:hypothetical protein
MPEFLLMREVADELRFTGKYKVKAAWQALARIGVPMYKQVGRRALIRRDDLDEVLLTGDCVKGRTRYGLELAQHHGGRRKAS